jgi:ELWxxDGT repeat protein
MAARRAILFTGVDPNNLEGLWVIQNGAVAELTGIGGAVNGTGLFDQFRGDGADFTHFNGLELFQGVGSDGRFNLWVTDGTAAGTQELFPANVGASGLFALSFQGQPGFTVLNNRVLFSGFDAAGNGEIWSTDGTTAGTTRLTDPAVPGQGPVQPRFLVTAGPFVMFNDVGGADVDGHETLWITDGTSAGTHEITGIANTSALIGLEPQFLGTLNGLVLFDGTDAANNPGLWVSNGTAADTFELTGIANASPNGIFQGIGGVSGVPTIPGMWRYSRARTPPSMPAFG